MYDNSPNETRHQQDKLMRNVAYKRVSTTDQEFHRQLADVNVKFDKEFADKLSGKDTNRPQLQACLAYLKEGDTLWVHEISRMARNVEDLRTIVFNLMDRKISVKFVKEGMEFIASEDEPMKTHISKLMLTMIGSFAEFERTVTNTRSKEGIKAAQQRGVLFGGANPKHQASYKANRRNHKSYKDNLEAKRKLQPVVSEVKKMVDFSGNSLTLEQMAAKLNENGYTTNRGNLWSKSSVSRLVKDFGIKRSKLNKHVTG